MRSKDNWRLIAWASLLFFTGCCCCGTGGPVGTDDAWVVTDGDGSDGGDSTDSPVVTDKPPVVIDPPAVDGEPPVIVDPGPIVVEPGPITTPDGNPVVPPSRDPIVRPSGEPIAGGELNKFFPDSADDAILIFKQEKQGFAHANIARDGVEVATLSISDTRSNPEAVDKYQGTADMIGGYPAAAMGSKATGVLVGSRFQVSVRSLDDSFTEADRRAWLAKFNLAGLSQLK